MEDESEHEFDVSDDDAELDMPIDGPQSQLLSATGRGEFLRSVGSPRDLREWTAEDNGTVHPQRVMCVNVKAKYLATDARTLLDALTPADPEEHAHAYGQLSLLSMLTRGTAKGHATGTSPEVSRLMQQGAEQADIDKENKRATPFSSYVFSPTTVQNGRVDVSDEDFMQYAFAVECARRPEQHTPSAVDRHRLRRYIRNASDVGFWGIRVWKIVLDPTHSDSHLWKTVMRESRVSFDQATNHTMPDKMRRASDCAFAKSARMAHDFGNLEECAAGLDRASVSAPVREVARRR